MGEIEDNKNIIKLTIMYPVYIKNKQQLTFFHIKIERKKNFISFQLPLPFNLFIKNAKRHLHETENLYIYEFQDIDTTKTFLEKAEGFVKPIEPKKIYTGSHKMDTQLNLPAKKRKVYL